MNRRLLLKLLAAAALAGCTRREDSAKGLRVVVVGAGIIGASIAYHLAKSGASVTLIDKVGPATHASRGTFAWINATWAKQPQQYHSLNQDSVSNWRELERSLNIPIRWRGSLEWFASSQRQQKLQLQIAEQAEWGERARMVGAEELAELEPQIEFGDTDMAAFSENDGAVDPVIATEALIAAAVKLGAVLQYPAELLNVVSEAGRITGATTSLGQIKADKIVLATGADPNAAKRFADVDIPQRSTPGVIATTAPLPRIMDRIIVAPGIHMHQRSDGRVVLGEQEGAPKNEAHALRLQDRPNEFPDRAIAEQHSQRMLAVATRFAPGMSDAVIESVYIGWRPLPLDGHPVLGASPLQRDAYIAITHSGVSLAPIVGQLAAFEITEGQLAERLDAFRPDRQFELVKRY